MASITAPSVYATQVATNLPIPIYEMEKESGPGMMSSDTTSVSITNTIIQNATKIDFKPPLGETLPLYAAVLLVIIVMHHIIIGAISIGASCVALGIFILFITTTIIILHCKKSNKCLSRNSQTG